MSEQTWHAVVTQRDSEGKVHHWNSTHQARDAEDAVFLALSGWPREGVEGVEVELAARPLPSPEGEPQSRPFGSAGGGT